MMLLVGAVAGLLVGGLGVFLWFLWAFKDMYR